VVASIPPDPLQAARASAAAARKEAGEVRLIVGER